MAGSIMIDIDILIDHMTIKLPQYIQNSPKYIQKYENELSDYSIIRFCFFLIVKVKF